MDNYFEVSLSGEQSRHSVCYQRKWEAEEPQPNAKPTIKK